MAIDIDGYVVLKAIASSPTLFADIRADVTKTARALAIKQLKAKTLTLDRFKKMQNLFGQDQLSILLDGLKDAEVTALGKKLDKNNVEIATASGGLNRQHLKSLADGSVSPAEKPPSKQKVAKLKPEGKKKVTRAISSEAMAARWDGTNPDDPKN